MPSYKLTYFNVRGRAEVCRMILAMAGQEFNDVLVTGEDWAEMKKNIPLGQLPVLEVDGKILLQSRAMASYLAREYGFYGSNSWETAMVDMFNGVVEDLWLPVVEALYESKDEAEREERKKAYFKDKFPVIMKYLEEELCKNKGGDSFLVGDKISLADLNLHTSMETIEATAYPDMGLDKYPKIAALRKRISAHEKLAPYLAKRKPSDI